MKIYLEAGSYQRFPLHIGFTSFSKTPIHDKEGKILTGRKWRKKQIKLGPLLYYTGSSLFFFFFNLLTCNQMQVKLMRFLDEVASKKISSLGCGWNANNPS